jgi:hypothetical protein
VSSTQSTNNSKVFILKYNDDILYYRIGFIFCYKIIMSMTTATTTTPSTSSNDRLPFTGANQHQHEHFINERYPKTCLEDIPSVVLKYPPRKFGIQSTRSRHSIRFRTQPVTLTEINETDEENKNENNNNNNPEQVSQTTIIGDFQRLEHLALSENIRRTARKKIPLKNYVERQRLKAMREEPSETDGN